MGTLIRNKVLVLWVWLMLPGVCLAKQVYLQDGGIVECQSIRRQGDLIVVQVNRDTVVEFERSEIDLRHTRLDSGKKPRRAGHKKAHGAVLSPGAVKLASAAVAGESPVTPPAASATPVAKPAQPAPVPAAKPAQPDLVSAATPPPASTPAPAAKEEPRHEPAAITSPEPAAPQSKDEVEKLRKQAAEMMAEAIQKKDAEMMKKAMELQRSAIPQKDVQGSGMSIRYLFILLVVCLLIVVSMWVVFEKGGEAGWKSLVPIYNMYVLMMICEKPGWWFLLLLIPFVGAVFYLLAMLALAERFGRGALFGIGLTFLPMCFFPLLAFGGSQAEA